MVERPDRREENVLTGVQDRILAYLQTQSDALLEFTSKLIAAPSPNPPGDERAVTDLVVEHLHKLGLPEIEVVGKSDTRPNVLCRLSGRESGSTLILNAHTDTKPVGEAVEEWESDPFTPTIRDGKLYGLGSTDMKAAVAAIVYAAAALRQVEAPMVGDLLLVLSADEEGGSNYGVKYLTQELGLRGDAAIVCEPSGIDKPWELLTLVARGICCFKVRIRGTQMHSSLSDTMPSVNASIKMAEVLTRMAKELTIRAPDHPLCPNGITLNLGVQVTGGVHYGVYPGYAEFASDLRTIPGLTLESVKQDLEAFLNQLQEVDPDLDVTLEFEPPPLGWIPPVEISPKEPVVEASQEAARIVLGKDLQMAAYPATTDGTHFAQVGIPAIPAFGPGLLPLAHSANEYVPVDSILQAAKIYALIALRFLAG